MISEVKNEIESNVMPLLRGIIDDTKLLLEQEVALVKNDIKVGIEKTQSLAIILAIGISICVCATFFIAIGAVLLLRDTIPNLPLWQDYGIVGLIMAVVGMTFIQMSGSLSRPFRATQQTDAKKMFSGVQHG